MRGIGAGHTITLHIQPLLAPLTWCVLHHSMALMGVRNGIVIAFVAALGGLW